MILSKSNSWMHKELMGFVSPSARYCYVQDIISMQAGRFVISDGFHFVASTIPEQPLSQLMEGYSTESLQLKGSVILVSRHTFSISTRSKIEMTVEDCIYFGEGCLSQETKDINRSLTNHSLELFQNKIGKDTLMEPLCKSAVIKFLDQSALLDPELVSQVPKKK